MKFIFLFALVAFGSVAAKKREPVQLVNPKDPDENKITFDCVEKGKEKAYCGRRMDNYEPFFQIKWAHRPAKAPEKDRGFNCERMNASNNYCCDPHWTPVSEKRNKRLSKRKQSAPDESTIFINIPEAELNKNCILKPGIGTKSR